MYYDNDIVQWNMVTEDYELTISYNKKNKKWLVDYFDELNNEEYYEVFDNYDEAINFADSLILFGDDGVELPTRDFFEEGQ